MALRIPSITEAGSSTISAIVGQWGQCPKVMRPLFHGQYHGHVTVTDFECFHLQYAQYQVLMRTTWALLTLAYGPAEFPSIA